jgi:hypothetical protein
VRGDTGADKAPQASEASIRHLAPSNAQAKPQAAQPHRERHKGAATRPHQPPFLVGKSTTLWGITPRSHKNKHKNKREIIKRADQ